jgi:glycosyltransferase involved in cell wall biosynthesis
MTGQRVVIVDLLCNSPFYSGALAGALAAAGAQAELASPRFYLEPDILDRYPRARWIVDLVVHASRPRVLRLAARSVEVAVNLASLLVRIAARRYDVVHVQWVPLESRSAALMRVLAAVCRRSGTLLVLSVHNATPHERASGDRSMVRANLAAADLLMTLSVHVAETLRGEVDASTPIETVPHGPLFADLALPSVPDAIGRLGLPDGVRVLFLGLIRAYKGLDLLAEAWPRVRASLPDAQLLVVGKVLDPAAAADHARLQREPGVFVEDGYVTVTRLLDYYAAADLVVFPYHEISQSAGVMTAAGLGRPILITPVRGLLEQCAGRSAVVASEAATGPAVADAIVAALNRRAELAAAATADRAAITGSELGWLAVARATLDAYARHRRRAAAAGSSRA